MSSNVIDRPATQVRGRYEEAVLHLGDRGQLIGVLTCPESDGTPAPLAVIALNAGVLHRVGPHRLYVTLARDLSARAVPCLRLDLSGIGDSPAPPSGLNFSQSAVADTCAAMDGLEQYLGVKAFVLLGICSGADNGLATAAADERVRGLILVDPPAFASWRSQVRHLISGVTRAGSASQVALLLTRGVMRVPSLAVGTIRRLWRLAMRRPDVQDETTDRAVPPIQDYRNCLTDLVERGVGILAIFSGALGQRFNDQDQLFELFPELRGRVDVAYVPTANHTFSELTEQRRLRDLSLNWLDRHVGELTSEGAAHALRDGTPVTGHWGLRTGLLQVRSLFFQHLWPIRLNRLAYLGRRATHRWRRVHRTLSPMTGVITVWDLGRERRVVFGEDITETTQSLTFTRGSFSQLQREYWGHVMRPPAPLVKQPRVLIAGLGGGTMVELAATHLTPSAITVIELDPEVIAVAREQMGLDRISGVQYLPGDVRTVLEALAGRETYDLVIEDVFFRGIPGGKAESIRHIDRLCRVLSTDGVLVLNRWFAAWDGNPLESGQDLAVRTLQERGYVVQRRKIRQRFLNELIFASRVSLPK